MQYRTLGKTGVSVSALGYGCMRFPQKNGRIDYDRTEKQVLQAIEAGVNYFDTAYVYHGGKSESVLGDILSKGLRDKVFIADKMPPYLVHSRKDIDRVFNAQLERLQTDHIDFYLMHSLGDFASWQKLKSQGIESFLAEKKASGAIRFIGFSWHGMRNEFIKVVDDYDWDFCQIQYNYLDERYQAGREGMRHAVAKRLGIVVMEPLRGGMLVGRLPKQAQLEMDESGNGWSAAAWALNWLWDQPDVSTVLSGMNEEEHIRENISLASESHPGLLSKVDLDIIGKVRRVFRELTKVDCTGCAYCMPCPFGVDIPGAFAAWNATHLFKSRQPRVMYVLNTSGATGGTPSNASLCTACGKCAKLCPQHIPIPEKLKEAWKELEMPALKPLIWGAKKYFKIKGRALSKKNPPQK